MPRSSTCAARSKAMVRLVLVALFFIVSGSARADGYSAQGSCFGTIEEAVSMEAYYWNGSRSCTAGQCRILSYTPISGATAVMVGNYVLSFTIPRCTSSLSTLPSTTTPTPWFGSDPGVVSACGNTVSPTGGLQPSGTTGTSGQSVTSLTPEQALERYNDGVTLGWGVAAAVAAAWAVAMIGKAFSL